jgi:hypothetical protein
VLIDIPHSASLDEQERKDIKSQNTNGNPIRLQGKILAAHPDPWNTGSIYVAQSNGTVRRIILAVSASVISKLSQSEVLTSLHRQEKQLGRLQVLWPP